MDVQVDEPARASRRMPYLVLVLALFQAGTVSCDKHGTSLPPQPALPSPTIPDPRIDPSATAQVAAAQKLDAGLGPAWRALKSAQWGQARELASAYARDGGAKAHAGQAEFVIGLTYHRQMLYAAGVEHFLRALQMEPGFLEAYFHAGYALFYVGRLAEARAALAVYARYETNEPAVPFGQGLVEIEDDHTDAAERFLTRAIELATKKRAAASDPRAVDADLGRYWARLGDVYVRRDETARACEAFTRAAGLRDDMPEIWSKLALARERSGDAPGAAEARRKYEELVRKGTEGTPPR